MSNPLYEVDVSNVILTDGYGTSVSMDGNNFVVGCVADRAFTPFDSYGGQPLILGAAYFYGYGFVDRARSTKKFTKRSEIRNAELIIILECEWRLMEPQRRFFLVARHFDKERRFCKWESSERVSWSAWGWRLRSRPDSGSYRQRPRRCYGSLENVATSSRPCTGRWSAKGWQRTDIPPATSCIARTRPSASSAVCSTRGLAATRWVNGSGC